MALQISGPFFPLGAALSGELWNAIIQDGLSYSDAMSRLEAKLLKAALESGSCPRREVASRLQTIERSLYYRLRSHEIVRIG